MTSLNISSIDNLKNLQNLAMILPTEKEEKQNASKSNTYFKTQSEKSQEFYAAFWNGLLTLFIKIPLIKSLILILWRFGLHSIQPTNLIKSSKALLFNSTIEIPNWFNAEMQQQASLTLRRHFLTELKMVTEQAPIDLNTLARLSQVKVSRVLYNYPSIIKELEIGLKDAIYSLIKKIHEQHPTEPLQLHLGGNYYETPLARLPLSGLFIQAFADCLEEYATEIPLRILHIHGPCDNKAALNILLERFHHCPLLYHLYLDLDEIGSKAAFPSLGNTLKKAQGLQFFVFRNYERDHRFLVQDANWLDLAKAINTHKNLKTLSFYDLPKPPDVFKQTLRGFKICAPHANSVEGFCIKKQ